MPKTLVVTPTYNEAENIQKLIESVLSQDPDVEMLVVDDNSPDGTATIVEQMQKDNFRIHLINRTGKMGLGTAYVAGFKYAIEKKFDYILEMDADFSHNPNDIPNFLKKIQEFDVVLGSRYFGGVRILNWPIRRLILSYGASLYTRIITGLPIKDATGGFKCFRRNVLEAINLDEIKSNGYAFQIEMNFKAWKKGFKIFELPIIFIDRTSGHSKMSKKIVYEAVFLVWKLKFRSIFNKL
ncbi:MAG: polyprenol monophosphomannose synthase [Bacteroidetes bacterium]|nr:polyprenol monophosphomannose synthase [Bacteroidota bacterium]MBU1421975.1 polyprenol monophosphomannose synthase [Bacteroidota bacterium]MBU2472302.1 polyprenol monophosphomannose synthase [Bacteroidota bacterium]MBU2636695.1 polyprenol monophosphomannose synthase [Bacteroidota bacterium]